MTTLQGAHLLPTYPTLHTLPPEIITAILLQLDECGPHQHHVSIYEHEKFKANMRSCALVCKCLHSAAQQLHDRDILLTSRSFLRLENMLRNKTTEDCRNRLAHVRKVTIADSHRPCFDATALIAVTSRLSTMGLTELRVLLEGWQSGTSATFGQAISTIPTNCLVELRLTLTNNNISESFGLIKASNRTLLGLSLFDEVSNRDLICELVVTGIPDLSALQYLSFGTKFSPPNDDKLIKPFVHIAVNAPQLLTLGLDLEDWTTAAVLGILQSCNGPYTYLTVASGFSFFDLCRVAEFSGRARIFPKVRHVHIADELVDLDDPESLYELFPNLSSLSFDLVHTHGAEDLWTLIRNRDKLPLLKEISISQLAITGESEVTLADLEDTCRKRGIRLWLYEF